MDGAAYRDLNGITKWLRRILIVLSLVEAVNLIGLAMQYRLLKSMLDHSLGGDIRQAALDNDARQQVISGLHVFVLLIMIVIFMRWVYVAMSNVRALGARDVSSPGWAVGGFFVPFLNFVLPCITMSQIWRASAAAGNWQEERASPLVGWWWALWLVVSIGGLVIGFEALAARDIPSLISLTVLSMPYAAIEIVRNIVVMRLTKNVYRMQDAQLRIADNFGAAVTPS